MRRTMFLHELIIVFLLVSFGSPAADAQSNCDVNRDGQVNALDLQILSNVILGQQQCPGNCDLNHDGKIDSLDSSILLDVILGIISCPPSAPVLLITTTSLPPGTQGSSYTAAVMATGGVPPYTWSQPANEELPVGLNLNSSTGAISGTTTTSGYFTVTAQVTDSTAVTVSKVFTIIINQPSVQIIVATSPSGLGITVDGTTYTTTQTFSWAAASSHAIATTSPQGSGGTQYVFANWSDSGAISHFIITPASAKTYTANFTTKYLLTLTSSPGVGGSITVNPDSADGYFKSGNTLQLTAIPNASYLFTGWSGDLSGQTNPQSITMSAPRRVTASFSTCSLSIAPTAENHGAGAEAGSVKVIGAAECAWTAISNNSWIAIISGNSGTGNGSVGYSVSANTSASSRTGTLAIAGYTFSVIQAGAAVPVISSLQPQQVVAGGSGFELTISGSNFVNDSTVFWNGSAKPTAFQGVSQLKATIPAADIATLGIAQVVVFNPSTNFSSTAKTFTITAVNPLPLGTRLSPQSMIQGGVGFTLTVVGSGFVAESVVKWNGLERGTTFESSTMLTAVIPASDLAAVTTAQVTVENPQPGGGTSTGLSFTVQSGTVITEVSPSVVASSSVGFRLTVFGTNFLKGTGAAPSAADQGEAETLPTVLWNGQPLITVVVSSTLLQAEVPGYFVPPVGQSAVVSVSGGGSGASNMVPVPITVTVPVPLLLDLTPSNVVPGSSQFTLTVEGKNFAEEAKVLWNGQERMTQFVDSTRLKAIIPETDISTVGASRVSVLNPAPGGGESNAQPFDHVQTLLFPRLTNVARSSGSALDDGERTGLAITNLGTTTDELTFTALSKTGTPISGTGITNPARISLEPGHQFALVGFQVFGAGLPADTLIGWFKMESSGSSTSGFFLMYSDSLSVLDGTDVSSRAYTSAVATEIAAQGYTELHVVNTDVQPAEVLLELHGADGQVRAAAPIQTLSPSAELVATVAELFLGVTAGSSDYVRVVSNHKVYLFERMGKPGQYVSTLNGQDTAGGGTVIYSPQYAVGAGIYRTTLSVVNLEDRSGVVTMRLVDKNGTVIAGPLVRTIAARGKLAITDQKFFVDAGDTLQDGYVEVRSDGVRLAGSVVFGDPGQERFSTTLPMVGRLMTDLVFNQVASDLTYFTGIAIVNPNPGPVTARIAVYDMDGTLVTSTDQPIPANGRVSKLLQEYCTALQGQVRDGGYIRVHTDVGVASFALFGTHALSALSAVPAQQVR